MKVGKLLILFILFLPVCAGISFAFQLKQGYNIPRAIVASAAQMPEFPGGNPALARFLQRYLKYPKTAVRNRIQGKVVLRFVVEVDGSISGTEILQSLDPECDRESLRVVTKMPDFNPAIEGGKPVACYYLLPINFSLL